MLIKTLENSEVISVTFIRDYLQIYFEGEEHNGALTIYLLPVAVVNGKFFDSETLGYRDSLCSFINQQVKNLDVIIGQKIQLTFDNNDFLEISLKWEEENGEEIAMLRVKDQIEVW